MPVRDLFLGSQPKRGAGYNPRPVALPAPTVARDSAPTVCLRVNVEWYAHLLGVLRILEHPLAWSGTDQEKRAAVSEITTLLNGVDCEVGLQDIRVVDCVLEKTFDGVNWTTVADLRDCSGDLTQILDGLSYDAGQGTRHEGGGDFTIVNMPDLSAGGHDGPCRAGHWVQGEIEDGLDNALSIVDASTDVATAIGEIITVLGAPGWILDYMIPWVTSSIDLGVAVIRSQLSTQLWDTVICAVMCNIDDDLTITADIRELIALDVAAGGADAAYDVVAWYIRSLSLEHWQYLLWRAQFSPTTVTCGFCSCVPQFELTFGYNPGLVTSYPDRNTATYTITPGPYPGSNQELQGHDAFYALGKDGEKFKVISVSYPSGDGDKVTATGQQILSPVANGDELTSFFHHGLPTWTMTITVERL